MKRKLSLVVAAMMLASSLAACAPKEEATTTTTAVEETTDEDGRAMEGNMYLTGLPLVKEKESFSIFCDDGGVPEEKVMYEILEKETNVHVDLQLMPYEAGKEKLNVLLNSGDYPDVIGGWLLQDKDVLTTGMKEQVFIPLDELYAKYSPKIEEVLDLKSVRETMTLPDGHIYTIPYISGEPLVTYNPWINQVWLDKLGLKMPTTTDEFKEVLIAFRDQDPNGNGKKDEIPFSCDPNNLHIGVMSGYFGMDVSAWKAPKYFTMVDGVPLFAGASEEFKQFMIWFADLYKEGLVDKELFSQDSASWTAKGNNGLFGTAIGYGSGFALADESPGVDKSKRRTEYEPLPVLKAPGVENPVFRRNSYEVGKHSLRGTPVGVTTFRTQAVITDKAKNPATIVRYYDNLFQFENSAQALWGPLGFRFEKIGDNKYQDIDITNVDQATQDKYSWAKVYTQSMPKYIPAGYSNIPVDNKPLDYDEMGLKDVLYAPYLNELMPLFWVGDDVASDYAMIQTDIENYMKKTIAEWAVGQKDVEAEWDNHLKNLEKLRLPQLEQIVKDGVASVKQ